MMEKFEVKGIWRVPDNPNKTINGTLMFDPSIGGSLSLMGSFKDITQLNEIHQPTIIQGITMDGRPVTLYKCYQTSSSFNQSGIYTTNFHARIIFLGINFASEEEVQFESMSVNFSHLDRWINISGFRELKGTLKDLRMEYGIPAVINWDVNNGLRISIDVHASVGRHRLNNFQVPREFHVIEKYYLTLTGARRKTLDYYMEVLTQLANFLSLMVTAPVYPLIIEAVPNSDKPLKNNMGAKPKIQVFFSISKNPPNIQDKSVFVDVLFTFEEISDVVESLLAKWFGSSSKLRPVRDLYFGTLINTNMYLYHGFSSLAQAIESYHRRVFADETKFPTEVYNQRITEILGAIQNEDYRNWLSQELEHSNEINLGRRLNNLTKTYPIITKLFRNREEIKSFINKVVNTRNYFTHYDEKLEQQAAKGEALISITRKLKIIVEICLLMDCGFNSEDIEIIMRRNSAYKDLLKR